MSHFKRRRTNDPHRFAWTMADLPPPLSTEVIDDIVTETARAFDRALATGDWTRAMELREFEIEVLKGGRR
jgi:hypothetical protein